MEASEPASGRRARVAGLHPLVRTAIGMLALVLIDGLLIGLPLLSLLLIVALVLTTPFRLAWLLWRRESLRIWLAGLVLQAIGLTLALGLAYANAVFSQYQADKVVDALQRYHDAHGTYPDKLETLVPTYLEKIPRLGFSLAEGRFIYRFGWKGMPEGGTPMLIYNALPSYAYHFGERRWYARD